MQRGWQKIEETAHRKGKLLWLAKLLIFNEGLKIRRKELVFHSKINANSSQL
jgi:hypothetical protein